MSAERTLYEVLGVKRRAKSDDIAQAYARLRAEWRKEAAARDPRDAAMAKVAYATLSDPDTRAEYDETLGPAPLVSRRTLLIAAGIVALTVAAATAYHFLVTRAGLAPGAPPFDIPHLLDDAGSRMGRVQAALVSGELRELGVAFEVGENEMLTTCRGIEPGASFLVKTGKAQQRAELARTDPQAELCTLSVKGAQPGLKLRSEVPPPGERLQAILLDGAKARAQRVHVGAAVTMPGGSAFSVNTPSALPNGTPIFDSWEQLVGIVISPHGLGEGTVVALPAARIYSTRRAAGAAR